MKRVIKAAYGYEWDGTPVKVKDWEQDFILNKSLTMDIAGQDAEEFIDIEDLVKAGFMSQEDYTEYEKTEDQSLLPRSITIRKGSRMNYVKLNEGHYSTVTFEFPDYSDFRIDVNFDWWRYELSDMVSVPMSDEEKEARAQSRERNKRNKELGLDKNGNPIMWGINNYTQTAVFNSPQGGVYNIGVIQSRGVVNSRQVGFKSEEAALDFLDKLQPDVEYELHVYKMKGVAVARHNWTEVDTKYGKAWITDTAKKSLPESSKEARAAKAKLTRLKNKAKDEIFDYIASLFSNEDEGDIADRLNSIYNIDTASVQLYIDTESCEVSGYIANIGTTRDQEAELLSVIQNCFVHKLVNVKPDYFGNGKLWRIDFELEYDIDQAKSKRLEILENYGISDLEAKVNSSTHITSGKSFYFGMEQSAEFGDLIQEKLAGKTVSKRKDLGDLPGGLVYEAKKLGIDMWDLLEALEGMCHEGRAQEIDDSTYKVLPKSTKSVTSSEDVTSAVMYIPTEKGDEWVLWFKGGNYVTAEYTGRTRDKKLKFRSVTYGDKYVLDLTTNTCKNLDDGKEYELDNESGWVDTLRKAVNQPINSSSIVSTYFGLMEYVPGNEGPESDSFNILDVTEASSMEEAIKYFQDKDLTGDYVAVIDEKDYIEFNQAVTGSTATDDRYQMCWWAKYLPAIDNLHEVYFEYCGREEVEFVGTLDECQRKLAIIEEQQSEEFGDEYPERYIRRSKGQPSMKYIYIPKSATEDANEAHEIMAENIPEPWIKCTFLGSIQKHSAEAQGATLIDTSITSAQSVLAATSMGGWEFDPIKESSHPDYSYWVIATKRNVGKFGAYIGGISLEDDSGAQLMDLTLFVSPIKPYDDADYHWAEFEGEVTRIIFKGKVVTRIPTDIRAYDADTVEGCIKSLLCDIFDTLTEYNQDIKPRMVHN